MGTKEGATKRTKQEIEKEYTHCSFCGWLKICIKEKGEWLCAACRRDDLTPEQKRGKHNG
jgi:hypothetical protein